ncbi:MAG: hypothetical protein HPM95_04120 [Alphaproteobacteria bacterium]|nr:hypothetical protein [Alphaproteobacteria bacterium]
MERALEQLAFAERDLDRASQLRESGAVTERTVDERSLIVSQRKQAVDQRRNALAVERRASISRRRRSSGWNGGWRRRRKPLRHRAQGAVRCGRARGERRRRPVGQRQ